jgi:hypothetical protein
MATNISNQTLEQYLLNELPTERMQAIKQRLEIDPELQQRIQALRQSNTDILDTYTPEAMVPRIKLRAAQEPKPAKTKTFLLPSLSLAAATMVIILAFPVLQNTFFQPSDTTRLKGESETLFIYRKTETQVQLLKNNAQALPGDLLQIAYRSNTHPFGIIVSLDGQGTVTLHSPVNKDKETKLTLNKKIALPIAYELDEAPEFERFFFITSETSLDISEVLSATHRLAENKEQAQVAPLDLPKSIKQISIVLKKGESL